MQEFDIPVTDVDIMTEDEDFEWRGQEALDVRSCQFRHPLGKIWKHDFQEAALLRNLLCRQIDTPQKAVLYIYVYGQEDISMNKRPNSLIFLHKTGALCWEADGNSEKLRNLFLIFKTTELGSGACD